MRTVYDYEKNLKKKTWELDKIEIQPSPVCNLRCPWCFGKYIRPDKIKLLKFEYYKKNLFDCLWNKPIIMIAGLYSEPLLYPEINKIFNEIKKKELRFGLYTNGILLKDIIPTEGSYISFNISGALYFDKFDQLLKNIRRLRKLDIQLNAPILLTDEMLVNIEEIHKKLLDVGIDNIRYSMPIEPVHPRNKKIFQLADKLKGDNVYWQIPYKPFDKCHAMTNSVSISPEGKVYPCSQVSTSIFNYLSFGSIKKEKFDKIWMSKKHKELFNNFNPSKDICRCNRVDGKYNTYVSSSSNTQ